MRGYPTKTPERVAAAQAMRATGMEFHEIAANLGIARTTAHQWITDPDGSRMATRKESYRGSCTKCGAPTDGSSGPNRTPEFCRDCAPAEYKIWTAEAIVFAIQEWADQNGGVPPTARAWFSGNCGLWPPVAIVQREWGSWNAAVRAAGFDPRPLGCYGREGEDPAEVRRTIELYESGLSLAQVGEVLGISGSGVEHRLKQAGVQLRSPAEGRALRRAA